MLTFCTKICKYLERETEEPPGVPTPHPSLFRQHTFLLALISYFVAHLLNKQGSAVPSVVWGVREWGGREGREASARNDGFWLAKPSSACWMRERGRGPVTPWDVGSPPGEKDGELSRRASEESRPFIQGLAPRKGEKRATQERGSPTGAPLI